MFKGTISAVAVRELILFLTKSEPKDKKQNLEIAFQLLNAYLSKGLEISPVFEVFLNGFCSKSNYYRSEVKKIIFKIMDQEGDISKALELLAEDFVKNHNSSCSQHSFNLIVWLRKKGANVTPAFQIWLKVLQDSWGSGETGY